MQAKDTFMDNVDFDQEDAMEIAFGIRKFLTKKLFKDYTF